MVGLSDNIYMKPEEYLNGEKEQEIKYEYCNGQVIAMIGGTINHGIITGEFILSNKKSFKRKTLSSPYF